MARTDSRCFSTSLCMFKTGRVVLVKLAKSGSGDGSFSYCRDIEGSPGWERLRVESGRSNASTVNGY
jgi:hypothetical protein